MKQWTLQGLYDAWLPTHKADKSTINCYKAAWNYFKGIGMMRICDITVDDLQDCIEESEKGKRTRENMKTLIGLLYKYGIPRNAVPSMLDMGKYLSAKGGEYGEKDGLPESALKLLEKNVGKVPGADYVVCQCYLGFRPSEFLALDAQTYNRQEKAFIGGAKTDAGKLRTVTVSPKIQPIVDRLTKDKISGAVFCSSDGARMTIKKYREKFYTVLTACGIDNPDVVVAGVTRKQYTPHSCRHTFATLLKRVEGADKDKLELIGHTSTEMLRHYQDVAINDLRRITDAM